MKKYKISIICLMILIVVVASLSLMFLSDTIPTHFGPTGQPDQYGGKYFTLIFPGISILLGVIMLLVSIKGKASDNYKKYLLIIALIIQCMFLVVTVVFVLQALAYVEKFPEFDISKVMMILFGILFIVIGNFMPKVQKNSTLGLKTSWALYNDTTWQKSQRFSGIMSVLIGVLCLISSFIFVEMMNFIILMVLIFIFVTASSIASYIYYKQEKEKEQLK